MCYLIIFKLIIVLSKCCLPYTATVEGVGVFMLNSTAVSVSWNSLYIPDFPIDSYTVVYSQTSGQGGTQDGEISVEFPPNTTSGIINGLRSEATYQFQVFATVEVSGVELMGEPSPVTENTTALHMRGKDNDYSPYHRGHSTITLVGDYVTKSES